MKAFIYTGGKIHPALVTEAPKEGDLVLAADSGYTNARALGVMPQILLGDFDSLGEENLPDNVELIRVPAEKDDTDTQLAVRTALERGANELVIIGGLEGRLDHTLSSVAILEYLDKNHIHALMTSGKNRVRFLRNNSTLIARSAYRYLSLIAADPIVKGVTLDGCKYPLKNARLSRTFQYAVSNEIIGNCAFLDVRRGGVWIIESID
ncbi:MAG: thiamine diphosphokinase [Ruminococcaceae bacterium]|nr:thiamine diphosphokinase [Oscillospiraceae bacterium]